MTGRIVEGMCEGGNDSDIGASKYNEGSGNGDMVKGWRSVVSIAKQKYLKASNSLLETVSTFGEGGTCPV